MTNAPTPIDYSASPTTGNIGTQTAALFVDAYRDLNAKKLFWIVLILSFLVVISFAAVGINDRGVSIFKFQFDGRLNTSLVSRGEFYKFVYIAYGVNFWLTWAATILAIVSTAGIFPELISGGAIDLYLSKPISRLRLFFTKYLAALLFVTLQTIAFSSASFLLIGLRGGAWEPGLFIAIPLIVIFFSYLYAICVLLGVLTRSTVAAMLLTLLIWFGLWAVQKANAAVHEFRISGEVQQIDYDNAIAMHESQIKTQRGREPTTATATAISTHQFQLDKVQREKVESQSSLSQLKLFDRLLGGAMAVLPKTDKTIELMSRKMIESAHLEVLDERHGDGNGRRQNGWRPEGDEREVEGMGQLTRDPRVVKRMLSDTRSESAAMIIGSSLAFEAVLLAWAAWIFCRRDY